MYSSCNWYIDCHHCICDIEHFYFLERIVVYGTNFFCVCRAKNNITVTLCCSGRWVIETAPRGYLINYFDAISIATRPAGDLRDS